MSRAASSGRVASRDFGSAIRITGVGNTIPNAPQLKTLPISYVIWANVEANPSVTDGVFGMYSGGANGVFLQHTSGQGINGGYGVDASNKAWASTGPRLTWGWHMLTVTVSAVNGFRIYVDGGSTPVTSGAWVGTPQSLAAAGALVLGQVPGVSNLWPGALDDFMVLSTELTGAQVSDLYYRNIIPASVAARYRMDEGSGLVLTDSVGTNHGVSAGVYTTEVPMKPRVAHLAGRRANPSGENLLPWADDLSQAGAWNSSLLTRTTGQADPFGGTTATILTVDGTAGVHQLFSTVSPSAAENGERRTRSAYIKAAPGQTNWLAFGVNNGVCYFFYDPATGNIGNQSGMAAANGVITISPDLGGGWRRVALSHDAVFGTQERFQIAQAGNGSALSYAGAGQGIMTCGQQWEHGNVAHALVRTTGVPYGQAMRANT